jgi:hypothetical protein
MRLFLKSLRLGIGGFFTIMMAALCYAPATARENAAMGANAERFDLVQMRLVRTLMTVAPDFTVRRFAVASGAPEIIIRAELQRMAGLSAHPDAAAAQDLTAAMGIDTATTDAQAQIDADAATPPRVRIEAGGAKFVSVD